MSSSFVSLFFCLLARRCCLSRGLLPVLCGNFAAVFCIICLPLSSLRPAACPFFLGCRLYNNAVFHSAFSLVLSPTLTYRPSRHICRVSSLFAALPLNLLSPPRPACPPPKRGLPAVRVERRAKKNLGEENNYIRVENGCLITGEKSAICRQENGLSVFPCI